MLRRGVQAVFIENAGVCEIGEGVEWLMNVVEADDAGVSNLVVISICQNDLCELISHKTQKIHLPSTLLHAPPISS
jgi:hypothetical protein